MSAARFVAFVMLVFILCAMPFVLVQASGVSSAGLSAGFRMPLEQPWLLATFLVMGMASAWLPKDGFLLVPFSCMVMVLTGASLMMHVLKDFPMILFIAGGAMAFIAAGILAQSRTNLVAVCIAGSLGFHIGRHMVVAMPNIAAPLFYLLGLLLAITLALAIAVAFGITLAGEHEARTNEDTPQTAA